jgi:phosphate uptake regulator
MKVADEIAIRTMFNLLRHQVLLTRDILYSHEPLDAYKQSIAAEVQIENEIIEMIARLSTVALHEE